MARGRRLRKSGGGELEVNKQNVAASAEAILLLNVVVLDETIVLPNVAVSDEAIQWLCKGKIIKRLLVALVPKHYASGIT